METPGLVKHETDTSFDANVIKSEGPSLVDFWAPWCGPCRAIGPILEELAKDYHGRVNIVKVNVDENPGTAQRFGVRSIPMLIFVDKGTVKETLVGLRSKEHLAAMIDRGISK